MSLNNSSPHRKPVKKKTTIRNSSISNQKSPIFNQSINLQREYNEWNNTFERLVNMMSIVVSKPTIPLDTNSNKRLFLEEMCSTVCKKANNSTPKKNNGVSNKIKRYQSILNNYQKKFMNWKTKIKLIKLNSKKYCISKDLKSKILFLKIKLIESRSYYLNKLKKKQNPQIKKLKNALLLETLL